MRENSGVIVDGAIEKHENKTRICLYAMTGRISRCNICDQFFQSKKELRVHKDREHRITNEKIVRITEKERFG
jgi:hypothetical protein